jgi:glycosyltransferase involved in cell wall biosynthesis
MRKDLKSMMKHKSTIKPKYELGCFMTVYNRPELLIDATTSILKCRDLTGIKFVICDDGSTDNKIKQILYDIKHKLNNKGNYCEIIGYLKNKGKAGYHKILKDCFKELSDCKYIMPLPPDFVFNPYLFQVARKCMQYISHEVKAITFSIDSRFEKQAIKNRISDFFSYTKMVDWGPGIFDGGFVKEFLPKMKNLNAREGTGTTHCIVEILESKGYLAYQYKNSLCQHMGNNDSVMNRNYRKELPLTNCRVNLDSIPEILDNQSITVPEPVEIKEPVSHPENTDMSIKKILVVKSCGVGNVIDITPAIIKLKDLFPNSLIDLLVQNDAMKAILSGWKLLRDIYIDGDQAVMPAYDIIINGLPELIKIGNLKGNLYRGEVRWYMNMMHEVEANMRILIALGYGKETLPEIPNLYLPKPKSHKKLDRQFRGKKRDGMEELGI